MKTLPSGKPQCDGADIVHVLWKSLTGETKKSKTGCNVIFSAKRSRVKYNGHFRKHLITPFQYNYLLPFSVWLLIIITLTLILHIRFHAPGFLVVQLVKNLTAMQGDPCLIPGSGRSPWRSKWRPTLIFLPRKSHGQRGLAGYSPWGHSESDTT